MEKKNMVFLSVIAVATLLTAVVGTTFSFFTAQATPDLGKDYQDTEITAATLGVVYAQDSAVTLENAIPGANDSFILSVKNSNETVAVDFNLVWKTVTNEFTGSDSANDITYKIESCSDASCASSNTVVQDTTPLPEADGAIEGAKKLTVLGGATNYYKITVNFANTAVDQSDLMGKKFSGQVNVGAAAQSGTNLSKVPSTD